MRLAAVEGERQQALDSLRSLGEDVPASGAAEAGSVPSWGHAALGMKPALGKALAQEQRAAERAAQAEQCLQGLAAHERAAQASQPFLLSTLSSCTAIPEALTRILQRLQSQGYAWAIIEHQALLPEGTIDQDGLCVWMIWVRD